VISAPASGLEIPEPSRSASTARSASSLLPVDFVENQGQWHHSARFVARTGNLVAALDRTAIGLRVEGHDLLDLTFEGAATNASLVGESKRTGYYNFFFGADPSAWRSRVAAFGAVGTAGFTRASTRAFARETGCSNTT
jgi:hypothetical protein